MFTTVQGKKIYYEKVGRGRPILLVHGWGGTSRSLKELASLLAKNHQTIRLDLPGFGASEGPDPNWGVYEYANLVKEFIHKLGLKRPVFLGHSFGGALGLYLASIEKNLFDKLIVCAPSYSRLANKTRSIPAIQRMIPRPIKLLLYRILYPESDMSRFPKLEMNFRIIVKQDLTNQMNTIATPTLILWGREDTYVPVARAKELQKLVKGSKMKIIEGTGHNLPLKHPELVAQEIAHFDI